jgi:hypothetical protein
MRYGILAAALLLGTQPLAAQEAEDPFWARSPKSMSDYLSEGWKVVSHTHHVYGNGEEYSLVLSRDNKSVMCFVWIPPKKAVTASCRTLN